MCKGPMPPELIEPVINVREILVDRDEHGIAARWWYVCTVCLEETDVENEDDVDFRCTKCSRVIRVED